MDTNNMYTKYLMYQKTYKYTYKRKYVDRQLCILYKEYIHYITVHYFTSISIYLYIYTCTFSCTCTFTLTARLHLHVHV